MATEISDSYDYSKIDAYYGNEMTILCKALTKIALDMNFSHMTTIFVKKNNQTWPLCFELQNRNETFLGVSSENWSAKITWYFEKFTAKRECFVNCWNALGNGNKQLASSLASNLTKLGFKARATVNEGNHGVAVDWNDLIDKASQ